MTQLLSLVSVAVALANGANDNFKGVATLFGSGVARYRAALAWATFTTFAGSAASILMARGLLKSFTGAGRLPPTAVGDPVVATCAAIGAATTVGGAAGLGLPVSTTHALLGGLLGAGAAATSGALRLDTLASRFVAPLVISPVLA